MRIGSLLLRALVGGSSGAEGKRQPVSLSFAQYLAAFLTAPQQHLDAPGIWYAQCFVQQPAPHSAAQQTPLHSFSTPVRQKAAAASRADKLCIAGATANPGNQHATSIFTFGPARARHAHAGAPLANPIPHYATHSPSHDTTRTLSLSSTWSNTSARTPALAAVSPCFGPRPNDVAGLACCRRVQRVRDALQVEVVVVQRRARVAAALRERHPKVAG